MKIGLLVAMDKEYEQLRHLENENIIVCKTGMGKVNAAINTTQMINNYHPDLIISSGCAGGASTELDVLDVIVGSSVVYHDAYYGLESEEFGRVQGMPKYYLAPENLVEIAKGLDYSHRIHEGLIASGEWFVDSVEKVKEILGHFPNAIGIDMESAAIAQTCHIFKVPFISFRVVSDVPAKENNVADYQNFWNTVSESSFSITSQFVNRILEQNI
ncbi:MAG: 5'-methylthioadenosine/S-adenosylhomocysteine nucleosidase [Prevotellaceae bacterium]|nr:5'-methylthioadenosine/S-adenosylhomocysteine nucleosidase [Prevotellaceae bacterium]